jgi:hypothetical protein
MSVHLTYNHRKEEKRELLLDEYLTITLMLHNHLFHHFYFMHHEKFMAHACDAYCHILLGMRSSSSYFM